MDVLEKTKFMQGSLCKAVNICMPLLSDRVDKRRFVCSIVIHSVALVFMILNCDDFREIKCSNQSRLTCSM